MADRHLSYAEEVAKAIKQAGFHCDVDHSGESVGKKVRNAQLTQINYMLTIGDKELENRSLNLRTRDNALHGEITLESSLENIKKEKEGRSLISPYASEQPS